MSNSTGNDRIENMKDTKYIAKWKKENVRRFEFYISKEKSDLLEWFNSVPSKQALVVELLEKEFKRVGEKV